MGYRSSGGLVGRGPVQREYGGADVPDDRVDLVDLAAQAGAQGLVGGPGGEGLDGEAEPEQPGDDPVVQVLGELLAVLDPAQPLVVPAGFGQFQRPSGPAGGGGDPLRLDPAEP